MWEVARAGDLRDRRVPGRGPSPPQCPPCLPGGGRLIAATAGLSALLLSAAFLRCHAGTPTPASPDLASVTGSLICAPSSRLSHDSWGIVQGHFSDRDGWLEAAPETDAEACVLQLRSPPVAGFVVLLRCRFPGRGTTGLSYRRKADGGFWPDAYYLHSLRPGHLRAVKKVNHQYTDLWALPGNDPRIRPDNEVELAVVVSGDRHFVFIGQKCVGSFEDGDLKQGAVAFTFAHGPATPQAAFRAVRLHDVNVEHIPRSVRFEQRVSQAIEASERVLAAEIAEAERRIAAAIEPGTALSDRELGHRVAQAHAMLWRYFLDPQSDMVYTIIEPHTGSVILPTPDDVASDIPNANGWSTPIEDCAGYGNGKHLAWLCARYDVTHDRRHAEQARRVFHGAETCGTVRPPEESGFAEIVRGVLPDGRTFYRGKHPGSSGDNYNGYAFGMWAYHRSAVATAEERARIRAITERSCCRSGSGAFHAMAWSTTGSDRWADAYRKRRPKLVGSAAELTSTRDEPSWTAVQRQLHWRALADIEKTPLARRAFVHALRVNAWGRVGDLLAGLAFEETDDTYWHRVKHVRNPMDGMLTVMLSDDAEAIEATLPLFRQIAARIDPTGLWDQRQLTPFVGAFWLGVKQGHITAGACPGDLNPDEVALQRLDPGRHPVVTYFQKANPRPPSPDGTPFRYPRADD